MQIKKMDRRVDRTRRLLRDALMDLILEKGYEAVTVEEVAGRANVGRTTFYLHYKDKEELLLESINAIVADLVGQMSELPPSAWVVALDAASTSVSPHAPIQIVFQHAAEHADLYQVMLRGEGSSKAPIKITRILAGAVQQVLEERITEQGLPVVPSLPLDVFCNYFAGSLLGIITWWLEADMPYPPEEMAVMFQKLAYPGIRGVFGPP
jgi:AcrR family transcriptional regulator